MLPSDLRTADQLTSWRARACPTCEVQAVFRLARGSEVIRGSGFTLKWGTEEEQ